MSTVMRKHARHLLADLLRWATGRNIYNVVNIHALSVIWLHKVFLVLLVLIE